MHKLLAATFLLFAVPLHALSSDVTTAPTSDASDLFKKTSEKIKARALSSQFPLAVTLPMEFSDVTAFLFDGKSLPLRRPDYAIYCTPEDAELMRDQFLEAKRPNDRPNGGCLTVMIDTSSTYDIPTNQFSTEHLVSDAIETQRKHPEGMSGPHRFNMIFLNYSKHSYRDVPAITFIQDAKSWNGWVRTRFLYIAKDGKVWVATHESGKNDEISASIWDRFIAGF